MVTPPPIPASPIKLLKEAVAMTGLDMPPWVVGIVGLFLAVVILAGAAAALFISAAKMKELWLGQLQPKFMQPEERRRIAKRMDFANHLKRELEKRDQREKWRDERFAELEAEVQADGRRRRRLPFRRSKSEVRREPSLTTALERSDERLILLEGDPGSGKSVAMRHVAHVMTQAVVKSRGSNGKLPIYVNLKELKRKPQQSVDHELIRSLVFESVKRAGGAGVQAYLDEAFETGIADGEWVFLFDSFDEIPEILSSTEIDSTIEQYSSAIDDFLGGLNRCRGVIASRIYRGPDKAGWRTFRIIELTPARQSELIRRTLDFDLAERVRGELLTATDDVRRMARNPLLLGLLCEHMRAGHAFPKTAYETMSRYAEDRFARDADRVQARFRLDLPELRHIAEAVAFSMTADFGIGLSPQLGSLARAVAEQGFRISRDKLGRGLEALGLMQLGRMGEPTVDPDAQEFTFTHRRFQEFFATCVVVARAREVPVERLLTDARWRETAVVLLQTGDDEALAAVLAAAAACLPPADPHPGAVPAIPADRWSPGQLHVLGILQAGAASSSDRLPDALRVRAGILLRGVSNAGDLLDRKLALEVAAVAPQDDFVLLMKEGLATESPWLSEVAYVQAARLLHPVPEVYAAIRARFARLSFSFSLGQDYHSTRYFISRLPQPRVLIDALRLAGAALIIDALIFAKLVVISVIFGGTEMLSTSLTFGVIATAAFSTSSRLWNSPNQASRVLARTLRTVTYSLFAGAFLAGQAYYCLAWTVYAFGWLPAALRCVRAGKFCAPIQWPLVHRRIVKEFFNRVNEAPIDMILASIYGLAPIALFMLIGRQAGDILIPTVLSIVAAVLTVLWITRGMIFDRIDLWRLKTIAAGVSEWTPALMHDAFFRLKRHAGRVALLEDVSAKPWSSEPEIWEDHLMSWAQAAGYIAPDGGDPADVVTIDADAHNYLKERDLLFKLLEKVRRDALLAPPSALLADSGN